MGKLGRSSHVIPKHSTANWCIPNHVAVPCGVVCIFACGHQLYLDFSRITVDYNPIYML